MRYTSDLINSIPPSGIRKFFDIASEMKNVISLSVGEPDFVTPWNVREAAIMAIERGMTHYTSNKGLQELREQICIYMANRFELKYNPKDILITVGASEAIDLAVRAIINPGEEVIIPAPSYVSYAPCVTIAGGKPVIVDTNVEDNFVLTPEELDKVITENTKAVILPYPNNPTGAIMKKDELSRLVNYLEDKDIIIISDEIYAELTYGSRHVSIASYRSIKDKVILINGFSKAFAMTGWRVGFVAANEEIMDAMTKIHQYTMLCASSISQMAALEALKLNGGNGYQTIEHMTAQYDMRRKKLFKAFNEMGLTCYEPKGAFYLFPCIKKTGMTSDEFCTGLLYEQGVALVPGTAFGESGEGFVRCSYAASMKNIDKAIVKIGQFVDKHNAG